MQGFGTRVYMYSAILSISLYIVSGQKNNKPLIKEIWVISVLVHLTIEEYIWVIC